MSSVLNPEIFEQYLHRDVEAQPVPVRFIDDVPEGYSQQVRAEIAEADQATMLEYMIDDSFKRGLIAEIIEAKEDLSKERIVSRTDELTGVGNRKKLIETFNEIVELGHECDVFFIDFDNFKSINDGISYSAGDSALLAAAENLSTMLRKGEELFRYGGDEFIIVRDLTVSLKDRRENQGNLLYSEPRRKNEPGSPKEIEGLKDKISEAFMQADQKFKELNLLDSAGAKQIVKATIGHATFVEGDSLKTLAGRAGLAMQKRKRNKNVA